MKIASRWLLLAVLLSFPAGAFADEPAKDTTPFGALKFRLVGPFAGGRVSRAAGVPGDPTTYYVAAAAGGVWKTTDAGLTFKPIFDDQPTSSIGAVAVAPSDPNVVYVGTGEANIRGNVAAGLGIFKSTDGGKNWKHVWQQEGQISKIIVHPANADVAYAAVLGHAFGPNPERGVYRTTDGGKTWQQILKKDADTGAIDITFDATNPRILFASLWQTRRRPWSLTSGGPGSGLYRSDDGGDTWTQIKDDLPEGIWGRVAVAVAPSDGRRVYVSIEAEKGGLYRSDDGGKSWELVNGNKYLRIRPWYYSQVTVDPANPDTVFVGSLQLLKSTDGGRTFRRMKGIHHVDHHDLWIDPKNPRRMINSNDGGIDITTNGGETWLAPPLPISQFYHVSADSRTPYNIGGNMQDQGTAYGPSNSLSGPGIQLGDWFSVGGGETGFTVPDPTDANIYYSGEYMGILTRFDLRTKQAQNVSVYPFDASGHGAEALKYRFQWTAPVMISPHDARTVYHGANVLFRTTDGGQTWKAISPDLTRDDKNKQKWSGGPLTGDNTGAEVYCTLFALAESPKQKGVLWAGSDDGLVHVSKDGGAHWENVTKFFGDFPDWATVLCIEPSPFDAGTAYVVADAHRLDNMRPYLWKTTDFGKTWKNLAEKLPQDVYLHVVREDPQHKGLLYLGTERGVMLSPDDGANWQALKCGLPTASVVDLLVKNNDLVVGTNGRSLWILDDLTPLREWAGKEAELPDGKLLDKIQPAVRWRYSGTVAYEDRNACDNPPKGAVIHYHLKKKAAAITLEILDEKGSLVQKYTSEKEADDTPEDAPDGSEPLKTPTLPNEPGVQRFVWDLAYKGAKPIKGAKIDQGNPRRGPLVLPGKYTIKLTVDGKSETATVQVQLDPRVKIADKDLAELQQLALNVRDHFSKLNDMVEKLRSIKKQLTNRNDLLKGEAKFDGLVKKSKELLTKIDALEEKMHNPKAEHTYDILALRGGAQLYSQFGYLYDQLLDMDGPVTQGYREVAAEHFRTFQTLEGELNGLIGALGPLNEKAKKDEAPIILPR